MVWNLRAKIPSQRLAFTRQDLKRGLQEDLKWESQLTRVDRVLFSEAAFSIQIPVVDQQERRKQLVQF